MDHSFIIWGELAYAAYRMMGINGFTYRPYELTINYTLKSDGSSNPAGVVSLEVTTYAATGGTGMPRVDTYNVLNREQGQRVTLQDLLGDNFKVNVNAGIQAKINEKPENYFNDEFKGISEGQSFYVEKGEAVIVFPKYSVAPSSTGTPEFRFNLPEKMTTKTVVPTPVEKMKLDLAGSDSLTNAEGVSLVPLRKVAEGIGYEVKWNQETYAAELKKGAGWTSVSVGKDSYFYAKMAPVTLGTAPVILNDTLYVPLKFVTDILRADVKTGNAGAIHIEQ